METTDEISSKNIQVFCRIRPFTDSELEISIDPLYSLNGNNNSLSIISEFNYNDPLTFNFDHIFDSESSQLEVYEKAGEPIVKAVMEGFNGTVLAYGQTASGKTYTMSGPDLDDYYEIGLIPRMVNSIFDEINNSDSCIEYTVKVSYFEIYLEKIRDLFETEKKNLKIHENKTRGIHISELTEKYVETSEEVRELIKLGMENRMVAYTEMNQASSRSHSLFCITIGQTNHDEFVSKTGKLCLVDLAGSEKLSKISSPASFGLPTTRMEETKNINKSLTMLGKVINSLADNKSTHIPYRNSKLTRVLQDSLGGNSKTILIVTCSPSVFNESETISTLRFGTRAKFIKNKPKINRDYSIAELKIMLFKCREELISKEKLIQLLKAGAVNAGSRVSTDYKEISTDFKEESPNGRESAELKAFDYDEILMELEDTRIKFQEQVRFSSKLEKELESKNEELNHQLAVSEVLSKKNSDLKAKIGEYEKIIKEKNEGLEKFEVVQETFEKELVIANNKVLELESKLNEIGVIRKREALHCNKSNLEELRGMLSKEKQVSLDSSKEVENLRDSLHKILTQKTKDFTVQQVIREEIARTEQGKWADERKKLMDELKKRINRIIKLELEMDDLKQAYINLEVMLSEGERVLKRKTETLERNFGQLTLIYHNLVSQKSQISVEKTLAEKRLARVGETIRGLTGEVEKFKELYESSDQKCLILTEKLAQAQKSKGREKMGSGNLLKTIHGGSGGQGKAHSYSRLFN